MLQFRHKILTLLFVLAGFLVLEDLFEASSAAVPFSNATAQIITAAVPFSNATAQIITAAVPVSNATAQISTVTVPFSTAAVPVSTVTVPFSTAAVPVSTVTVPVSTAAAQFSAEDVLPDGITEWIFLISLLLLSWVAFRVRTRYLRKNNRLLREKEVIAQEVLQQKNQLSRRHKNFEDSLKYAQRIQYAMFTSESEVRKMFPESFILQRPKDIVSGDFFWARKAAGKVFLAVADCTGHGVPGAFMSLIGLEFFRQIIDRQCIHQPSLILNEINRNFDLVFDNMDDIHMRDGMDLSFCSIDVVNRKLEFAGAFNPVYIIRNGEIIEIKGDKNMIGPNIGIERIPFRNHEFELQEDDIIYLFSDGYADQFGGPEGKKFKYRRFRHLLLSIYDQPLSVQQHILDKSLNEWKGGLEQVDDILVLGVKPLQKARTSVYNKDLILSTNSST